MRTSNHVGRPAIFDGNTFLGATGIPRREMALVNTRLDDWLPEPLTVATRIVKSFTERTGITMVLSVVTVRPSPACRRPSGQMDSAPWGRRHQPPSPLQTKETQCSPSPPSFFSAA